MLLVRLAISQDDTVKKKCMGAVGRDVRPTDLERKEASDGTTKGLPYRDRNATA